MALLRVPVHHLAIGESALDVDASKYLLRVHRLARGKGFVAFDPSDALEADAQLIDVRRGVAYCRFAEPRASTSVPVEPLTLVQAFAKNDKVDQVIRDATCLGATRLVVAQTDRSVVKVSLDRKHSRRERWLKIAVQAARQCGRGNIPEIVGPIPWSAVGDQLKDVRPYKVVLEPAADRTLASYVRSPEDRVRAVIVGPEGGWSPQELAAAVNWGALPARFGSLVLRSEIATCAVLGALLLLNLGREATGFGSS